MANLYPITPTQDYILFSRFKSSHYYRMQMFKILPYYTHGKPIHCNPQAILNPAILFPIFTLKPTRRFWNLYPIISMQHNTPLYWFKSSIRLQIFKYIAYYPQGKTTPYYSMQHFKLLSWFKFHTNTSLHTLKSILYYIHVETIPNYSHAFLDPTITNQVFTLLTGKILSLLTD